MKIHYCNKCGQTVSLTDECCPHCGNTDVIYKKLDKRFYCSHCGHKISAADKYCPKCGKDVSEDKNLSHYNIKSTSKAFFFYVFLGLIGGHKFYEGKFIVGLAYLLTFAGFGTLWLYDLINLPSGRYYTVPKRKKFYN